MFVSSRVAIASRKCPGARCAYLSVISSLRWPSISAMVRIGTPCIASREPTSCRRSWKVTIGKAEALHEARERPGEHQRLAAREHGLGAVERPRQRQEQLPHHRGDGHRAGLRGVRLEQSHSVSSWAIRPRLGGFPLVRRMPRALRLREEGPRDDRHHQG